MSETERLLNDIRAYLRISAAAASKAIAAKVLDTYEKALVYSKLDGKTSQRKIEADTQVPQKTISNWSTVFVEAGLASPPDSYNQNYRALFTLQELGIELATLKKRAQRGAKPSLEALSAPIQEKSSKAQQGSIKKYLGEEKSGTSKQ